MPYSTEHTKKLRSLIVDNARVLFNREGFENVSIDQVMAAVGLIRGGFYNHFANKDELFAEAVASFLNGRGKTCETRLVLIPNIAAQIRAEP